MAQQPNAQPSNGLGIAGFVISLVGLVCTWGALSPVGMVLSFIAMFKEPKGLAIAGFILGLLGSFWIIIAIVFIGLGTILAAFGVATAFEFGVDSVQISMAVQNEYRDTGAAPADLSSLGLNEDTLTDGWGNPYRYTVSADGSSFTLTSDGPDGVEGTGDDITGEFSFGD